ncbi:cytochrome P450 [Streptomyces sp. NPDC018031]|uniref:cytochrome P450 n=1 Tax=Streptomyces sp. NPDC018031 TaxID=3365033 RepID=UPI0037BD2129
MTQSPPAVGELPMTRPPGCPFDPAEELTRLRRERPLVRMRYPDGHLGWLVTSHALVRSVLADPRFSTRAEIAHSPFPGAAALMEFPPAAPGMFLQMDAPEHTRYRRMLTGKFTVRRMRRLAEHVEKVATEQLDHMERMGPPVDLVRAYAQPVPALMICELLGVPYADRELFRDTATTANDPDATQDELDRAMAGSVGYLRDLVRAKRAEPTDDLLGDLATTGLTDEELVNIAILLMGAGLETTSSMLALGTFALLGRPEQLDAWRADGDLTDGAVEELLRYLTITPFLGRAALEDVELGGEVVRAGEMVTLAVHAADRDPARFADPDDLDLRRSAVGHLAFGHGIHQCLGQQLARVEMRVAFPALFRRFPTLRLAVPPEEVPLNHSQISGVLRLPVTWDGA